MAVTHQKTGGGAAEAVGRAGDEDTGHGIILPSAVAVRAAGMRTAIRADVALAAVTDRSVGFEPPPDGPH